MFFSLSGENFCIEFVPYCWNFGTEFVPYFEILLAVCSFGISLALKNFDQFGTVFSGDYFSCEFDMFFSSSDGYFLAEFVPYCEILLPWETTFDTTTHVLTYLKLGCVTFWLCHFYWDRILLKVICIYGSKILWPPFLLSILWSLCPTSIGQFFQICDPFCLCHFGMGPHITLSNMHIGQQSTVSSLLNWATFSDFCPTLTGQFFQIFDPIRLGRCPNLCRGDI